MYMYRFLGVLCLVWSLTPVVVYPQSVGKVLLESFYSDVLGVSKQYQIYLPPGYDEERKLYPVVYFLRLHEGEWFDRRMPNRNGKGLQDVADALIDQGLMGKMILVGPSTGSDDGSVAGMVNMRQPDKTDAFGIGSGRFEDYFIEDLIPEIESRYRILPGAEYRGVDGFSFGGYTALVLTMRNPGLFSSVGSYDGTHMWHDLEDPAATEPAPNDPFWLNPTYDSHIGALFGVPRDVDYMLQHSAVNVLLAADEAKLDSLRAIRFHIHTGDDDAVTNMRRTNQLVDAMAARGINNSFPSTVLITGAQHDFSFANFHASKSLIAHWETFQGNYPVSISRDTILSEQRRRDSVRPASTPNPFYTSTHIEYNVAQSGNVTMVLYDATGRKIRALVIGYHVNGTYNVEWDGLDEAGVRVAPGIYIGRLKTATRLHGFTIVRM